MRIPLEVRIGFFVILFAGILVFVLFRLGYLRYAPRGGYRIYVYFSDLKGLRGGASVLLHGHTAGYVESTGFDENKGLPFAVLFIYQPYQIPVDSHFSVGMEAIIGEPRVMIRMGKAKEVIQAGETAPEIGEARPTFEDLVAELTYQVRDLSSSVQQTMQQVAVLLSQIEELTVEIEEPLRESLEQLPALASEIRYTVLTIQNQFEQIGQQIREVGEEAQKDLQTLTSQLSQTLGKFDRVASQVEELVGDIQSSIQEQQIIDQLGETLKNLREISEDIRKIMEEFSGGGTGEALSESVKNVERISRRVVRGVEELAAIQGSLETWLFWREGEDAIPHRIGVELYHERAGWFFSYAEEQVRGKTREFWHIGAKTPWWRLGVGRRRGNPSLLMTFASSPVSLEADFWLVSSPTSLHYQVLFSYYLRQKFSAFVGVEREDEPLMLFGLKYEY